MKIISFMNFLRKRKPMKKRSYKASDIDRLDTEWRAIVHERDNHRCQLCGTDHALQAHYILGALAFPELRHEPKNGVTLCWRCDNAIYHRHTSLDEWVARKYGMSYDDFIVHLKTIARGS